MIVKQVGPMVRAKATRRRHLVKVEGDKRNELFEIATAVPIRIPRECNLNVLRVYKTVVGKP